MDLKMLVRTFKKCPIDLFQFDMLDEEDSFE